MNKKKPAYCKVYKNDKYIGVFLYFEEIRSVINTSHYTVRRIIDEDPYMDDKFKKYRIERIYRS